MHCFLKSEIWQKIVEAMDYFILHGCACSKCGTFSGGSDALEDRFHIRGIWISHIIKDFGKVWDYIRCSSAICDYIMNPRLLRNVLTEHVNHVVHRFNTIECRATPLGSTSSVR